MSSLRGPGISINLFRPSVQPQPSALSTCTLLLFRPFFASAVSHPIGCPAPHRTRRAKLTRHSLHDCLFRRAPSLYAQSIKPLNLLLDMLALPVRSAPMNHGSRPAATNHQPWSRPPVPLSGCPLADAAAFSLQLSLPPPITRLSLLLVRQLENGSRRCRRSTGIMVAGC